MKSSLEVYAGEKKLIKIDQLDAFYEIFVYLKEISVVVLEKNVSLRVPG